jgi:hypothetical protein
MAAALLTVAVEGWCDPGRAVTPCGLGCLLAGMIAGGGSGWYALRAATARRPSAWVALGELGCVASLTAALGCVGLGVGRALAVVGAVAAGAVVAWIPARARS